MRTKRIVTISITLALTFALLCAAMTGCAKKSEPEPKKEKETVATEPAIEPAASLSMYFSPYTGLPVADAKYVNRRPLSIKIENSPESWPQSGIGSADIVYETRVEGGMSRFNCIFQSDIPDEAGPVRSARLSDAWIAPQYNALFYYSGSNSEVKARLNSAGVTYGPSGSLLHRVGFKSAPHNLYMDVAGAYKAAKKKDIRLNVEIKPLYFGFERTTEGAISGGAIVPIVTQAAVSGSAVSPPDAAAASDAGIDAGTGPVNEASGSAVTSGSATAPMEGFAGEPARSLRIDFYSEAKWEWDAARQVWLRYTAGNTHLDGATEEQLYADNVAVIYAEYPRAAKLDPAGSPTYDTNLGGEGEAMLFRDGYVYKCKWRADKDTPPAFFDESGAQLPLKQGKTWLEVPPTSGMDVQVE